MDAACGQYFSSAVCSPMHDVYTAANQRTDEAAAFFAFGIPLTFAATIAFHWKERRVSG